ncbi:ABC transporter permease [Desertihabitans aurantiacus]|uniref:ABC transporter permease n=1 Tax=Desertihabitans aurantiacus TaxID=2282477 RepID=UPI0018E4F578|nr:ABC transporter permease [Desertihabitans aurantiacus]
MSVEVVPDLPVGLRRQGVTGRVLRRPAGAVGAALLVLLALAALAQSLGLLAFDPAVQDPPSRLQGPSAVHWFGTDQFGRDLLARVLSAVANSLRVAVVAVLISAVVGTALGLLAGYFGRGSDLAISGVTNVLFAFPPMLLALALTSVLARNWFTVAVAIAVVYVPIFVRTTRGATLSVRQVDFVRAAVSTGQHPLATVVRHVLPNVAGHVVVVVALALSWAVLTEAALSFLGLGTPPPAASLGSLILDARTTVFVAWWTMLFPGVLVVLLVIAFNLLGDALRDALDPRGRR